MKNLTSLSIPSGRCIFTYRHRKHLPGRKFILFYEVTCWTLLQYSKYEYNIPIGFSNYVYNIKFYFGWYGETPHKFMGINKFMAIYG